MQQNKNNDSKLHNSKWSQFQMEMTGQFKMTICHQRIQLMMDDSRANAAEGTH